MNRRIWRNLCGWMMLIIAVLCSIGLAVSLAANVKGLEWISMWLFLLLQVGVVSGVVSAYLLLRKTERKWKGIFLSCGLIYLIIISFFVFRQKEEEIISISPDFQHSFVIKKQSDRSYYFNTYFLLFGRAKEALPYAVADYTTTWLTNEACVLTYRSPDRSIHQYIGTYGGNTAYYSYVQPQLTGTWQTKDGQVTLAAHDGANGITISDRNGTEIFSLEQMVQFGTTALVFTDEVGARWSLALPSDARYDEQGYLEKDAKSSVVLFKASLEQQEPRELYYQP